MTERERKLANLAVDLLCLSLISTACWLGGFSLYLEGRVQDALYAWSFTMVFIIPGVVIMMRMLKVAGEEEK